MSNFNELHTIIEQAYDNNVTPLPQSKAYDAILQTMSLLNDGQVRVAQKVHGKWVVNVWVKKAVLLSFRIFEMREIPPGLGNNASWWDKIPLKYENFSPEKHQQHGARVVPGSVVRYSSFIAPDVVLMPCFVNVGAFVDSKTMIDTWATVGSCAQIGKRVHVSGGAGIAGVLEPLQANPVIIEDDCFIGARSEIAEGVVVGQGSVISMGVFIGASTKIVHRDSGHVSYGYVPPYSVVVPGSLPASETHKPSLACAVIVKQVDEQTRSKTSINDLLRE